MKIIYYRNFDKRFAKLPLKIKDQFKQRRNLFIEDKKHPILNNHSVDYAYPGCRSINVTGDYRAIFRDSGDVVLFINIGDHSDLY